VLASKVRYGIDPSISALAVVIIVLTLIGAAVHEVFARRELSRSKMAEQVAAGNRLSVSKQKPWYFDPALIMIFLIVVAGVGTTFMAGTMGVEECKVAVKSEKQRATQERIKALRERNQAKRDVEAARQAQETEKKRVEKEGRTGTENFNSIFNTDNLAPAEDESEAEPEDSEPKTGPSRTGTENFNSIFSTDNLAPKDESEQENDEQDKSDEKDEKAPRTGTENFNNIFDEGNLAPKSD